MTKTDSVVVYSKMEWFALIHEFGVTWKMTDKQRSYLFGVVFEDQKKGLGDRETHGVLAIYEYHLDQYGGVY